jgi:hypothetical protein
MTFVLAILACAVLAGTGWAQGANSAIASLVSAERAMLDQQRETAEALVARREAASGRRFDASYRQWLVGAVAAQAPERLQDLLSAGDDAPLLNALGDSAADLVYTPVAPCRVFDTRFATAGILAGGTQRNFLVAGSAGFPTQGGLSGGCGIPFGPATSVIINFAAVTPNGAGNIRAWAVASPQPDAPTAAVMNFWAGLTAVANGVAVPICNPAVTSCGSDLRLQADAHNVHVVGDVVGYFRKVSMPVGSDGLADFAPVSGTQYVYGGTSVSLPSGGTCLVTCEVDVESAVTTGTLFFTVARYAIVAGTDESASGWGNDLTWPSSRSAASATRVFSMPAGTAYNFGCRVYASGDYIGKTAYPTASWICR